MLTFFESGAPKNVACTQEPSFITQTGLGLIKSNDHSETGMAVIDAIATCVPTSPYFEIKLLKNNNFNNTKIKNIQNQNLR